MVMSGLISLLRVFLSPFWVKEAEKKEKPVSAPCRLLTKPRKDLCSQCVPFQEVPSLPQEGLPLSGFPENRTCLCSGCLSWPPQQTIQLSVHVFLPSTSTFTGGQWKRQGDSPHSARFQPICVFLSFCHRACPRSCLELAEWSLTRRKCISLVSWWEQLVKYKCTFTFKKSYKWRCPKNPHLSSVPW